VCTPYWALCWSVPDCLHNGWRQRIPNDSQRSRLSRRVMNWLLFHLPLPLPSASYLSFSVFLCVRGRACWQDGRGCGEGAKSYDSAARKPSLLWIIEYSMVGGKNRACCVPLTVVSDTRFQTPPAGTRQLFLGTLYIHLYTSFLPYTVYPICTFCYLNSHSLEHMFQTSAVYVFYGFLISSFSFLSITLLGTFSVLQMKMFLYSCSYINGCSSPHTS
jgi:hypothetical protein